MKGWCSVVDRDNDGDRKDGFLVHGKNVLPGTGQYKGFSSPLPDRGQIGEEGSSRDIHLSIDTTTPIRKITP